MPRRPAISSIPTVRRRSLPPLRAWAQLTAGLMLFGLAIALMIQSGLGLGPWDALHMGIHRLSGLSVGMATILVGIAIVAGTYFMGERPGSGTVANMVLIGVFTDVFLLIVPSVSQWMVALAFFALGIVLCAVATGMYIAAGLGKGPRDGLMIGVSQRTGWRVGRVRTAIEVVVLALGWWMGGTVGIGTLLFAGTIGPATQWGLQLFGMTATGGERGSEPEPAPTARRWRRAA